MKGFAFTLMFVLIASLLVIAAVGLVTWKEGEPAFDDVGKRAYIADDVAQDVYGLMGVSFEASVREGKTVLAFSDQLPSSMENMNEEMAEYVNFVEGEYARAINSEISLRPRPALVFSEPEFSYLYGGWGKGSVSLFGEVEAYEITMKLDDECGACIAEGAWNWTGSGAFVRLNIQDSKGTPVAPGGKTSGYVDNLHGQYNYFTVGMNEGGLLRITLFREEFGIEPQGVGAELDAQVTLAHAGEVRAGMPLDITIDGTAFGEVPVYEK